jgi:hypothetical protein
MITPEGWRWDRGGAGRTLDRVLAEAMRWDVVVRFVPWFCRNSDRHGVVHTAPTHLWGIDADMSVVWSIAQKREDHRTAACGLLHEVLHAMLWRRIGVPPCDHDEVGPMRWLEHEAARRLRLPGYAEWMRPFAIGENRTWPCLSSGEKRAMLRRARDDASALGLVDADGRPIYRTQP